MEFKGKEYTKGKGSCMDCSCSDCNIRYGEEYRCTLPHGKIWIECKEKEEPKTKRVAVIWFGDVPECTDYVDIRARQSGNEWDKGKEFEVEAIDPNRLIYKCEPKRGETIIGPLGVRVIKEDYDIEAGDYLTIDPPAPDPETVEEVWKRVPNRVSASYNMLANFIDDLEAAQDREQDKKEE